MGELLGFHVEVAPCAETIRQFTAILRAYEGAYFTEGYGDSMAIDAPYQRLCTLQRGDDVLAGILFTCLDGSPHITAMATKITHKGKGYGKQLMEHFTRYVAQLGFCRIELYAWSEKTKPLCAATQGFYRAMGFVMVSEHPDLWEQGQITVKMRKTW